MSDPTDEQLMRAFRNGDMRAFEQLVGRHEGPVWRFLLRSVGDPVLAQDLLQEVFLRVVRTKNDWKGQSKFSTWLCVIARNLCVDEARRAVHRTAASMDAPLVGDDERAGTLHDHVPSRARDAEGRASDGQLRARIDAAVAALPHEQREVFLMREALNMPFAEIATVVGSPEPTVKTRMRYALDKLRAALEDYREAAPDEPAEPGTGPVKKTAESAGTR